MDRGREEGREERESRDEERKGRTLMCRGVRLISKREQAAEEGDDIKGRLDGVKKR